MTQTIGAGACCCHEETNFSLHSWARGLVLHAGSVASCSASMKLSYNVCLAGAYALQGLLLAGIGLGLTGNSGLPKPVCKVCHAQQYGTPSAGLSGHA